MDDKSKEFGEQLSKVRPITRHLITSVLMDQWPSIPAVVDFGIDSQQHYEALYFPIRNREISPKQLDDALGNGEQIAALVRAAPSNPHKDIEFQTSWDIVQGRVKPTQREEVTEEKTAANDNRQERDGGIER